MELLLSSVEGYARPVLYLGYDSVGNERVQELYKVFIMALKASSSRRTVDSCSAWWFGPCADIDCRYYAFGS